MSSVYVHFLAVCGTTENTARIYEGLELFYQNQFEAGNEHFKKMINRDLLLEEGMSIESMSKADKSMEMYLLFSRGGFFDLFDEHFGFVQLAADLVAIAESDGRPCEFENRYSLNLR